VRGKVLSIALVVIIVGTLGTLNYVLANPVEEEFTEFYITGESGRADDYPEELNSGDTGKIVVGIVNHEHRDVFYRLKVKSEEILMEEINPIMLKHEQKWEQEVSITPIEGGEHQEIEFLLYRNEESEPYLEPLYLWINATDESQ